MEARFAEMQQKIDLLTKENEELKAFKQQYNSSKQSVDRLSTRLRKLCKKLAADPETLVVMQKLADEIREHAKAIVY